MSSIQGTASSSIPSKVLGAEQSGIEYRERSAVRVVVRDTDGQIILIKASKENYYKLPGGGIEGDEDHQATAQREALEETGCRVTVKEDCVATTEEYRHDLHQISFCYLADLQDKDGKPELTVEELADGLSHQWVSVDEALKLMSDAEPTSELGRYIKERDIFLLKEALRKDKGTIHL